MSPGRRDVIQRKALDEQEPEGMAGGLIVDDEARSLAAGQMRKSEFLAALRMDACAAADEAMAESGRSTAACPYVERMIASYARRDARHLERAIQKYVPVVAVASRAADYLPLVSAKVARGARTWAQTGRLPEDVPAEMRGAAMGGGLLGALAAGLSGMVSAIGSLFTKGDGGPQADGVDRAALGDRMGAGRPIEGATRSRMEDAFGHSFGAVRIHADAPAAELSRDFHARAFTLGSHVAFGRGEYRPGEPAGDALLAHELAHVVQQGGGATPGGAAAAEQAQRAEIAPGGTPLEADADRAAAEVVTSLYAPPKGRRTKRGGPRLASGPSLQRCNTTPTEPPKQDAKPGAKPPEAKKDEAKKPEAQEAQAEAKPKEPEPQIDWTTALPEAKAATPGVRKEGVKEAQGPLTDFKIDTSTDAKGTPTFSYRTDVGAFTQTDDAAFPNAKKAAAQVEAAREHVRKNMARTFVRINERTAAGPMAGYERSARVMAGADAQKQASQAEKDADASYAEWLKKSKTSGELAAFSSFEGDPASMQGSDKANLTWGPGVAASGGGLQRLMKEVIDKSPEAKQAFFDVGISMVQKTEVQRWDWQFQVVDTEKKWRLVSTDAELYIRSKPELLAVFVNIAQGYTKDLTTPSNALREVYLKAISARVPRSGKVWKSNVAKLMASRGVHSGSFGWDAFDENMSPAQVRAVLLTKMSEKLVDQIQESAGGGKPAKKP